MAIPGTADYYRLPMARRLQEFNVAKWYATAGGSPDSVPLESYFSAQEAAYIAQASKNHLQGWAAEVQKKFPSQAPYLSQPEIAEILHEAADKGWTPQVLQSHLEASTWWKSHSPSQRSWFILNSQDPAAAHQSIQGQMQEIVHQAQGMGIKLSYSQAMVLSAQTLDQGWSAQHLLDMILNEGRHQDISTGSLHVTKNQLKKVADDYLMPAGNDTLNNWTRKIAGGTSTVEAWRDSMQRYAIARFADTGLKAALQSGMTVREFADPYIQIAAQTLGKNPNDISLLSGKWKVPLEFTDHTGQKRAMNMNEWEQKIKLDPAYGYDQSKNGIGEASTLASGIRERFGVQ